MTRYRKSIIVEVPDEASEEDIDEILKEVEEEIGDVESIKTAKVTVDWYWS